MQEYGSGEIGESVDSSPYVFETALLAAGFVLETSRAVLAGKYRGGFCLVRPPGHHATPIASAGLCVFNNLAITAQTLLNEHLVDRIAIIDFDTHYGDGLATIFYEDPRVLYMSAHEAIFGRGDRGFPEEIGAGPGEGYNICFPLPFKSTNEQLADVLQLFAFIATPFRPDLVLVSAGFDGYYADPIGNLSYTTRGYYHAGETIQALAQATCGGKVVASLEGGYSLLGLPLCIAAFLQGLLGFPLAENNIEHPVRATPPVLAQYQLARANFFSEVGEYWQLPPK
jgi:acetoin utilization deacetylase AcuC-like enzyme